MEALRGDIYQPPFFDRFKPGAPVSRAGFFTLLHDFAAGRVVLSAVAAIFYV